MDIKTYLPDELGRRAKDAGIGFSALLRDAVTTELERLDDLATAREGMTPQDVEAGTDVRLHFTGKYIGGSDPQIYLTAAGAVVVVWPDPEAKEPYYEFGDVDEFEAWVSSPTRANQGGEAEQDLADALVELGGRRVVELS
jgi:hypothetical protein